jgi:geranylgeranyl diphosphate synthase type II
MSIPISPSSRTDARARGRSAEGALEQTLGAVLDEACAGGPPDLASAMRHAVFPGGSRLRPQLAIEVACALGSRADDPELLSVAAALELFHSASLVHDDLPCFDDASVRRGRPSVHAAFGEPLAVLVGDALIVAGFSLAAKTSRPGELVTTFARALGPGSGLIAGQGWESERRVDVSTYHRAKTGALFEAATAAGALVAGGPVGAFAVIGQRFGEAYQILDDIADAAGSGADWGKRLGRDAELARPNAVHAGGLDGAKRRFEGLLHDAILSVPECPGRAHLVRWLEHVAATTLTKALPRIEATGS